MSIVTVSELLTGVYRTKDKEIRKKRKMVVDYIIDSLDILPFTMTVADIRAQLHAELAANGRLIGAYDMIIAATAMERNFPVITNNIGEFSRVKGLEVIGIK